MFIKRISLRLAIALATFLVGIGIIALSLINGLNPHNNHLEEVLDCTPKYSDDFSASDYNGVLTKRIYVFDPDNPVKAQSNEDINAESTLDVFTRFRETPFSKLPECVDESYRLTWLPTFHAPTVVRVWRSGEKHFIVTKRLNGKGGYGLGDLDIEQSRPLTTDEWEGLRILIDQTDYWNVASAVDEPVPYDGATWTFEGFSDGNYHSVFRISPSIELSQVFKKFFETTGIETEHERYLSQAGSNR